MIKKHYSTKNVFIPGDKEKTIDFCVELFVEYYKQAVEEKGMFTVALSGGSTPKAIYQKLASMPYKKIIDWSKVLVFWSDERSCPPTDPDSNYKMALDHGLKDLVESKNTFRMQAEEEIEENASKYEKLIQDKVGNKGFDLVMLGMGDDGHTASLFPKTKGLNETKHLVIANHIPQKNTWRMTLTFPCINNSKHICVYVLGDNKKKMVKDVLEQKTDYPAAHVGTPSHKSSWILDTEAAQFLL